jgi:hypothetical protein
MTPAVLRQLLRGHARRSIIALIAGGGSFIRRGSTPMVGHNRDLAAREGRPYLVADLADAAVGDTAAVFDTVDTDRDRLLHRRSAVRVGGDGHTGRVGSMQAEMAR